MRIRIKSREQDLNMRLPTALALCPASRWAVKRFLRSRKGILSQIPPKAVDALFAELWRIKKVHGSWELVDIEESDGDMVKIQL